MTDSTRLHYYICWGRTVKQILCRILCGLSIMRHREAIKTIYTGNYKIICVMHFKMILNILTHFMSTTYYCKLPVIYMYIQWPYVKTGEVLSTAQVTHLGLYMYSTPSRFLLSTISSVFLIWFLIWSITPTQFSRSSVLLTHLFTFSAPIS